MTATIQVFPLVKAKLTPQSLEVLKKYPELRGNTVEIKDGFLEGTFEEVQGVRLKILKTLYSDNTQQPATFKGVSSGTSSPSEAEQNTGLSEAFKAGNFEVEPSYYVYETSALRACYRKEIETTHKCSIVVKGSAKLTALSSPADYLKVSCSSQSTKSEQALSEYYQLLQTLRLRVSKMVFPLPVAVQKLNMEAKLSELLSVPQQFASSNEKFPVYVCSDYDEHVIICMCDNHDVEMVEFRMRQLIRTVIFEQLNLAKIIQPLKNCAKYQLQKNNCQVSVCEADLTKLSVDIAVNTLNPILKCDIGLSGAILKGAGAALQQELDEILRSQNNRAIDVGSVVCTRAYNLPCEFVLHTVGPNGKSYTNKKEFQDCLRVTYANTFLTAADLYPSFLKPSIALPLVSAGIYRGSFSYDDCVQPLIEVLQDMSDVLSRFSAIYLCYLSKDEVITTLIGKALSNKKIGKSINVTPPMLVCADASLSYYAGQTFQVHSGNPDEPYGEKYKKLFAHRKLTAQAPLAVIANDSESASNTTSPSSVSNLPGSGILKAGYSIIASTFSSIFATNS